MRVALRLEGSVYSLDEQTTALSFFCVRKGEGGDRETPVSAFATNFIQCFMFSNLN